MILLKKIRYFILNSGLSATVFTTSDTTTALEGALKNPIKEDTFAGLAKIIADVMIAIGIPVAAIFIIYAGFLFVSARGSEDQITKAKTTFYWTILGVALLVGAKVIASALQTTITGLGK